MNRQFPSDILSIVIRLPSDQADPYLDKLAYCCDNGVLEKPLDPSPSEYRDMVAYFCDLDKLIKDKSK